jgi:hypothetical protein
LVETAITNNATIEGAARFGARNSNRYRTLNNGTINANAPGQHMDFHSLPGVDRSVNAGTMKATNGGQILFGQGVWLNTGTVEAIGPNALAAFYAGDGFFEGGIISAVMAGGFRWAAVSMATAAATPSKM